MATQRHAWMANIAIRHPASEDGTPRSVRGGASGSNVAEE